MPGSYVLSNDLVVTTAEPALTIRANNVTVDLNGHEVSGPGTNSGTGILIQGASGVRLKNGYIRDLGFGVTVMNSSLVTIEGLHIAARGLPVPMPPPEVGIMIVNSRSVTVRHNSLFGVGLGVFVRGPGSTGNHIYENTITASMNGLLGVCYNPAPGETGGPRGDTVERNSITGFRFGIQVNAGGPNVFKNNTLFYTMGAFEMATGTVVQDVENTKVQLP
jgi:nitrous oxidase accessory protein NosD